MDSSFLSVVIFLGLLSKGGLERKTRCLNEKRIFEALNGSRSLQKKTLCCTFRDN